MVFHYHKPLTGMYGDNYRYGTSLYSPSVGDVEKNYRSTLSRTNLRSDRGDLGLYTFAGSNLHGGAPANEKLPGSSIRSGSGSAPRYSGGSYSHDLYAPINTSEYGTGYYDHLRATSPTRTTRHKPEPYYDLKLDGSDYITRPARISVDDSGSKKVTKTTTTTEHWVPLTTHFYHTPYHSYYYSSSPYSSYTYRTADDLYNYGYVDDYKRYSTTKTTTSSKNIDALDLSVSKNYEYSHHSEKCKEIQSQLDEVSRWISEAESKLKNEVVSSRSKMQSELAEVALIVEDTAKYNDDLHRVIKKQAKQISQLGSQYDEINRHLVDISDTIEKSRSRCQSLQSELSSVQSVIEVMVKVQRTKT